MAQKTVVISTFANEEAADAAVVSLTDAGVDQHPAVAHQYQFRDPRRPLLLEQRDGIASVSKWRPRVVGAEGDLVPGGAALLGALLDRQVLDDGLFGALGHDQLHAR